MKKVDYKEKLLKRKIKRPSLIARIYFRIWTSSQCRKNNVVFHYDFDKKSIKKQQILVLSTHASRNEFFYTMGGLGRTDINMVVGFQNFFKSKTNYFGLTSMQDIPKFLFQPDMLCTKRMLQVIKSGGSLALWPEGIQSISGSTHPINPATCKFIKRAGVTVVLATTQGAYLTTPRYSTDTKRGKIFVNYKILFTADQLKSLTDEQIYQTLMQHFRYDDFANNKVSRVKYVGKKPNVDGLDNILYICPKCHGKHTLQVHLDENNDRLECDKCGYSVTLNEYYDLIVKNGESYFDDVDKWFKWQRRVVRNQVREENFQLSCQGSLSELRTDCWKKSPQNRKLIIKGNVTLDKNGLTVCDGESTLSFGLESLYSLTVATSKFLEFYYKDDYYVLELDIPKAHYVEWMLTAEELHNTIDAKWDNASNDVYDYQK